MGHFRRVAVRLATFARVATGALAGASWSGRRRTSQHGDQTNRRPWKSMPTSSLFKSIGFLKTPAGQRVLPRDVRIDGFFSREA
jgi:hypothetical protein